MNKERSLIYWYETGIILLVFSIMGLNAIVLVLYIILLWIMFSFMDWKLEIEEQKEEILDIVIDSEIIYETEKCLDCNEISNIGGICHNCGSRNMKKIYGINKLKLKSKIEEMK